jgi:3-deoxy-7-phosphoheptulonate synthase
MEALGERSVEDLTRVDFYTSHEGLNLLYESAQTRTVPRRPGHYCLTTHMPWIGDRTRSIDGAHVEFFRGIRNPLGIKVGAKADPAEIVDLVRTLNPANEHAKCVLISRMGASKVKAALPPLIEAVAGAGLHVLWVCDPMHANTITTASGRKTRPFEAIIDELGGAFDVHDQLETRLGGVHFELTGENVTECTGGATGLSEAQLETNYASPCDPRLNYQQSLEMAFYISKRLGAAPPPPVPG